jgi:GrpB-like predicted nucleotidyltransferase (UPF0157 family)/nitrite reductase/ring-hydroxylating ferredoxin subunit
VREREAPSRYDPTVEPRPAPYPPSLLAPGVDPDALEPLLAVVDLPPGTMRRVAEGDLDLLLAHTTDGIVATDDRCPHMSAPLSIGELDGCVVACPLHEGRFDLRSGNPARMPTTGGLDPDGVYHSTWTPGGREPKTDPPGKKAEARRLTRVRRFRYYPVRLDEGAIWVALPLPARSIEVVAHDPSWAVRFEEIRATIAMALGDVAARIEHIGSTSVPGLAAKPIIDIDVVVETAMDVAMAIERLNRLGYTHLGELGIAGRVAFRRPAGSLLHNLYVCRAGSLGLRNHLALRDHLRTHPDSVDAYGTLKQQLAANALDIDAYTEAKTDLIVGILATEGFQPDELDAIRASNRARG